MPTFSPTSPEALKRPLSVAAACLSAVTPVRALGLRLFGWWRGAPARTGPLGALAAEPFTEESIALAPASRGIYQLYRDGEVIYAGMALASLRRELESHRRGQLGECTRAAGGFLYKVAADPEEALRDYLRTYMACNGARLPPCNQLRERQADQEGRCNAKHANQERFTGRRFLD